MTTEQWIGQYVYLVQKCLAKFELYNPINPDVYHDYRVEANMAFLRMADNLATEEETENEINRALMTIHEFLLRMKKAE